MGAFNARECFKTFIRHFLAAASANITRHKAQNERGKKKFWKIGDDEKLKF
jgi:hypothetical protein